MSKETIKKMLNIIIRHKVKLILAIFFIIALVAIMNIDSILNYIFPKIENNNSYNLFKQMPFKRKDRKSDNRLIRQDNLRLSSINEEMFKYGYIDENGKLVIEPQFIDAGNFSEGLASVRLCSKKCKYGFINKEGRIIIPYQYDNANSFSEGLAAVKIRNKWGYINKEGIIAIDLGYEYVADFSDGLAAVSKDKKFGFIKKNGEYAIKPKFDDLTYSYPYFNNGIAFILIGNKYGIIDKKGNYLAEPQFDDMMGFSEGMAAVLINGKCGYINTNTYKLVIEAKYDNDNGFCAKFSEGFAPVIADNKVIYINKKGLQVIPEYYMQAKEFSEGFAAVAKYDRWGFINKNGDLVIPMIYKEANNFANGFASIKSGNKWGFINKMGELITPIIYEDVGGFINGFAAIKLRNKWGIIDKAGAIKIRPQFDSIRLLEGNNKIIEIGIGRDEFIAQLGNSTILGIKKGLIDFSGRIIIPPIYNNIYDFHEGLARVAIENYSGVVIPSN